MLLSLCTVADGELSGDWRARLAVAQQLAAVAAMVSSAQSAYCLWPLLMSLLRDPVCAVRAAAAAQAGPLLVQLPEQQLPAEQSDAQRAAAAAEVLSSSQEHQQKQLLAGAIEPAGEEAAAVAAGGAEEGSTAAAEHVIASVVATRAVSTTSSMSGTASGSGAGSAQLLHGQDAQQVSQQLQQPGQQQQQQVQGSTGQPLRWVRRGFTSGLSQLQQQVRRLLLAVCLSLTAADANVSCATLILLQRAC